jgi:hypothetical protein
MFNVFQLQKNYWGNFMAKCPECRLTISNNATRCPHCTTKLGKSYNAVNDLGWIFCIALGIIVFALFNIFLIKDMPWWLVIVVGIAAGIWAKFKINQD